MKYELDEDAVAVLLEYVEEALVEIAEVLDGPQHQEGATGLPLVCTWVAHRVLL